jgi:hypothetical protein
LDGLVGLAVCTLGVPGLVPISLGHALAVLGYSFLFALIVNDFVKPGLIHLFKVRGPKGDQ